MLHSVPRHDSARHPAEIAKTVDPRHNREIEIYLAAARRQLSVLIICSILGLMLGVAYLATAVPQYTASTTLLLDNKRLRGVEDAYDTLGPALDAGASFVESQVEVLKSDKVALYVVDKLQLTRKTDSEPPPQPSVLKRILKDIKARVWPEPKRAPVIDNEATRRIQAADAVRAGMDAFRVPRTLLIQVFYTSPSPDKAATVANAFADAYLVDQLDAKFDAAKRASAWLEDRMAELKQQVLTTDLAVQRFKASNNLISSGGKLVNEQQLGEVNTQLVTARAETARAEARYDRIKTILDGHMTDAVVTEAIGNSVIEQLRTKYVNAAQRQADLLQKLGPDHDAVVNLRSEMREYERLMFDELGRIAEVYRSELDIAKRREEALKENFASLVGANASSNETLVALRELERESESYRTLYQSFLQRYQQVVQNQSFPITDARVIRSAQPPFGASKPQKMKVMALSLLFGIGLGVCFGVLREMSDSGFRMAEQVRDELGLEFIGLLPAVAGSTDANARSSRKKKRGEDTDPSSLTIGKQASIMRYVVEHPLSGFAETLRSAKIAADLSLADNDTKVIGICSVLSHEGKSTVSKNFASLLAHLGAKTLLIDADLRNPSLTRALGSPTGPNIVDAVLEGVPLKDVALREEDTSLSFIPAAIGRRLPHTSEFLASPGMKSVLRQARDSYQYIIIDLPPLGAVVDSRALSPQLDAVLLVVEWGKTARRLVRTTLDAEPQISSKCLGVIYNKVKLNALKLYESTGSTSYYRDKYTSYYHDGA
jgi:succinoglycan biosynthesis transport protein ExoP